MDRCGPDLVYERRAGAEGVVRDAKREVDVAGDEDDIGDGCTAKPSHGCEGGELGLAWRGMAFAWRVMWHSCNAWRGMRVARIAWRGMQPHSRMCSRMESSSFSGPIDAPDCPSAQPSYPVSCGRGHPVG